MKIIVLTLLIACAFAKQDHDNTVRLINKLFTGYNTHVIPDGPSKDEPLKVKLGMYVRNINEFDDQELDVTAWTYMQWRDPELSWDPAQFGGVESIRYPSCKVWRPDLELFNSRNHKSEFGETNVVIMKDGTVIWVPIVKYKTFCISEHGQETPGEKYTKPATATCTLTLGSWTYDGYHFDLEWEIPSEEDVYIKRPGKWNLVSTTAERKSKKYDCCPEPYITMDVKLKLEK